MVKSRGLRARTGSNDAAPHDSSRTPDARLTRRRSARLINRIWQVDPLACPRCGASMRIIGVIGLKMSNNGNTFVVSQYELVKPGDVTVFG